MKPFIEPKAIKSQAAHFTSAHFDETPTCASAGRAGRCIADLHRPNSNNLSHYGMRLQMTAFAFSRKVCSWQSETHAPHCCGPTFCLTTI